ncbi:hypothetical protein SADUNF_Sadunf16G0249500 [Salix dunnii]|uniref:Retrotransposon Copia-like N-terminal domain-containing protein n=1 Tax=Salix dunnii TaxID=1413687 RepID=A0A835MMQ0_9ROSI|nr:hypothetical protein SADUNF_Sadunf16G0249500 [Salix dunnii]
MVSELSLAHASIDPMSVTKDSYSSAAFHLPAQVISIKLDGTNFLSWSAQLLPLFRSYGLMGIVDGSEPSPSKFSSTEHQTQGVLNSDYVVWQYKDQTTLGWIISSLSPAVVSTIYGLETSRLAWQALGARFAAPSTSLKSLADELSAVGKPIDDSYLILSVLNGLNSSFHSFVTTYMLLAKEKSMSFSDFHAELLNFDLMQKFHSQTIHQETGSYAAFYSHKPGSKTGFRNSNKMRFSGPSKGSSPGFSQFRQPLPHLPSSPSSTAASNTRSRSPCQICKRDGHQALDCFNRMNYSFQGRHPPTELAAMETSLPVTVVSEHAPPHPPSCIVTRSQTGHSKPRNFPDYQLHYTTRHPLQALHAGVICLLGVSLCQRRHSLYFCKSSLVGITRFLASQQSTYVILDLILTLNTLFFHLQASLSRSPGSHFICLQSIESWRTVTFEQWYYLHSI